jgi:hypothetical protein
MDDGWPGILFRLEGSRAHAGSLLARAQGMRRFHRTWLWVNRCFMLVDVVLIVWNLSTIGKQPSVFLTWFSGCVTAVLFWSFCNTWRVSESRWREYMAELAWIEESIRWLDVTIERVKGMHAHQN